MYLAFVLLMQIQGIESLILIAIWQFGPLFILGISLRLFENKRTPGGLVLILASVILSVQGLRERLISWNTYDAQLSLAIASLVIVGVTAILALANVKSAIGGVHRKSSGLIILASQLTYPFYLLHESFGEGVISLVFHVTHNKWASWATALAICLILSSAVLKWANWVTKRFNKSSTADVKV
jgi:peptidoglycan/LPS O-acetylase OafA/YrhL